MRVLRLDQDDNLEQLLPSGTSRSHCIPLTVYHPAHVKDERIVIVNESRNLPLFSTWKTCSKLYDFIGMIKKTKLHAKELRLIDRE